MTDEQTAYISLSDTAVVDYANVKRRVSLIGNSRSLTHVTFYAQRDLQVCLDSISDDPTELARFLTRLQRYLRGKVERFPLVLALTGVSEVGQLLLDDGFVVLGVE